MTRTGITGPGVALNGLSAACFIAYGHTTLNTPLTSGFRSASGVRVCGEREERRRVLEQWIEKKLVDLLTVDFQPSSLVLPGGKKTKIDSLQDDDYRTGPDYETDNGQ